MILNYSVSFPGDCGCNSSQSSSCNSTSTGVYGANTQTNTTTSTSCGHQQACSNCIDVYKGECVRYTGSNLTSTGINANDDLNIILQKLDAIKAIQDIKNDKILEALNDINSRLNAIESGADHAPYTLM